MPFVLLLLAWGFICNAQPLFKLFSNQLRCILETGNGYRFGTRNVLFRH